jgi:hypothetical protein
LIQLTAFEHKPALHSALSTGVNISPACPFLLLSFSTISPKLLSHNTANTTPDSELVIIGYPYPSSSPQYSVRLQDLPRHSKCGFSCNQ